MSNQLDLECRQLVKSFGKFTAVDNVSLEIPKGSFFSILGPSGCGKTTLLRMLAGFIEPTAGDIVIKEQSMLGVPPNKRPVNMVFQHLALFPMMNVAENIAYGLKRRKLPQAEIDKKVADVLERVSLPDAGPKDVTQLSGGQRQRIAIARSLVLEPAVLLLDEPLGALDLKLREHMKVELKQLQHEVGTTFVYITHDQSEALVMSDNVAVMNEGRFEQVGSPQDLYYNPQTAFVAGFVGDTNRWSGRVDSLDGGQALVLLDDGGVIAGISGNDRTLNVGDRVELFVRPEAITIERDSSAQTGAHLEDGQNTLSGIVENLLFDGANSRAQVRDQQTGHQVTVSLPQTGAFSDLKSGEQLRLSWGVDKARAYISQAGVGKEQAA
ncbi:spermidine/putrescine ABC transporter ATP-binding protein [Kiloniella litopenaei]|uniref:Spermidine/putrescine ABC transporter ATP-binding protein n=1 Tax=Kiloniella litopenaei TaxID=1549748 RepID=A0A0M2R2T6_9PROT|nr:ABC transporter ATP-binding protein [Kiloniella litopenaei]KKJ76172.1 spermidine/putrescine ABC transporter ATP-binding protein [Kiloniella litopenaei]